MKSEDLIVDGQTEQSWTQFSYNWVNGWNCFRTDSCSCVQTELDKSEQEYSCLFHMKSLFVLLNCTSSQAVDEETNLNNKWFCVTNKHEFVGKWFVSYSIQIRAERGAITVAFCPSQLCRSVSTASDTEQWTIRTSAIQNIQSVQFNSNVFLKSKDLSDNFLWLPFPFKHHISTLTISFQFCK